MRLKRFSIGVIAAAFVCALALSACSSSSNQDNYSLTQEGALTVATTLANAPYEYTANEAATGYGVAVIQEVANRLGLACSLQTVTSGQVMSAVSGNSADVGVASLTINAENSQLVDFTTPYYYADQALVVKEGAYESAEELSDLPVAAIKDSTAADYAEYTLGATVSELADAAACFRALENGTVRAVAVDYQVASYYLANGYAGCEILERYSNGEKLSIAVNQNNDALKDVINAVIEEMEADGTLKSLQDQYLY